MADTLHLNDGTIEVLIGDNTLGRIIYEKLGREAELLFNQLIVDAESGMTDLKEQEIRSEYEDKINELEDEITDLKHEIRCLEGEIEDLRDRFED